MLEIITFVSRYDTSWGYLHLVNTKPCLIF